MNWDELKSALDSGNRFKVNTERGGLVFKKETMYRHDLPNGGGSSASDCPLFINHVTFEIEDLIEDRMPKNFTTMKVRNYLFVFDFDTGALEITDEATEQVVLDRDAAMALGDFLVEVLSTQGYTPQVRPLRITNFTVE